MYDHDCSAILHYAAEAEAHAHPLVMEQCADLMTFELNAPDMEGRGHIIELTVRLHNVCAGKRTALGVLLHETDENGNEQPRGLKTVTVPAHNESAPCDILVRNIRFVLPEDVCMNTDVRQRKFIARTVVHYIDIDSSCACPVCYRS